jgi:S1-C subfamily serine protease
VQALRRCARSGLATRVDRQLHLRAGLEQATGAVVTAIAQNSPASETGMLTGDIILSIDGAAGAGADDIVRLLDADRIGRTIPIDVRRRFWVGLTERKAD